VPVDQEQPKEGPLLAEAPVLLQQRPERFQSKNVMREFHEQRVSEAPENEAFRWSWSDHRTSELDQMASLGK